MNIFDNVRIILTTRGRIDVQHTLNNLSDDILKFVTIVCYPGEKKLHDNNWITKVKEIIEHPQELVHLGQIRKWCIESSKENYVILIDDNMIFSVRLPSQKQELKSIVTQLNDNNFDKETIELCLLSLFLDIIEKLKTNQYGIVGLSSRQLNPKQKFEVSENIRIYGFWGVNKLLYKKLEDKLSWSEFYNKNDFALQLEFLTNGIKNLCLNNYAFSKCGGANSKGGCSILRNQHSSNKEAFDFKERYGEFVKIREKSTKSWNNFGDKVFDVMIFWKKAFEYGITEN
jgi:hypothetical protein